MCIMRIVYVNFILAMVNSDLNSRACSQLLSRRLERVKKGRRGEVIFLNPIFLNPVFG